MINIKKIISLIFLSFSFVITGAMDNRDADGKTPLMKFIIKQENAIRAIEDDIERLWHICYEQSLQGYVTADFVDQKLTSEFINKNLSHAWQRRDSATDDNIKALKQRNLDIRDLIIETCNGIRSMTNEPNLEINAVDSFGNTALNYCYTYKIYLELRRQGASFQLPAWSNFNPKSTTALLIGCFIFGGRIGIVNDLI